MQASVEVGDDVARLDVGHAAERRRMQPLQQKCAVRWIGAQQPDGTLAGPAPEHEMFMLAFLAGAADLEDCSRAIGGADRLDDRASPDGIAVGSKRPLVQLPLERDVDRSWRHGAHVMTNAKALG